MSTVLSSRDAFSNLGLSTSGAGFRRAPPIFSLASKQNPASVSCKAFSGVMVDFSPALNFLYAILRGNGEVDHGRPGIGYCLS